MDTTLESAPLPAKPTLLDRSLELLEEAGLSLVPEARVCLVGQLAPGTTGATFGSWCEMTLKKACPTATGLLLMLPTGFLHTFEGPQPELSRFLKELAASGTLAAARVIAQQESVRTRYFPHWIAKEGSAMRSNYMELDEDAVPALLAETAIGTALPLVKSTEPREHDAPSMTADARLLLRLPCRDAQDWQEV